MYSFENIEQFNQLREIAAEFAGKFEEDIGAARLSLNNFYGDGTINSFVITPGYTVFTVNLFLNKEINPLKINTTKDDITITYCMEGKIYQIFGITNSSKAIRANENIIFHSNEPLEDKISFPTSERIKGLFIKINKNSLDNGMKSSGEKLSKYLSKLFYITDSDFMISNFILPKTPLYELTNKIIEINELNTINKLLARGICLQIIALQISQLQTSSIERIVTVGYTTDDYKRFFKHLKAISGILHTKITIENFSIESGISRNKLQQICKENFGVTFKKLIKDLRLEKARFLIQNTELSISEICYDIGYTSRSFFSKEFKVQFGLNPSDFKNGLYSDNIFFEISYYLELSNSVSLDDFNKKMNLLTEAFESLGITGILIHHNERIFHIIEGSRASVVSIFNTINKNEGENKLNIIFKGIRKSRRFCDHKVVLTYETKYNGLSSSIKYLPRSIVSIINNLDNIYLSGELLWKKVYNMLKSDYQKN